MDLTQRSHDIQSSLSIDPDWPARQISW